MCECVRVCVGGGGGADIVFSIYLLCCSCTPCIYALFYGACRHWSFVPFAPPIIEEKVKLCKHKDHEKMGLPTWGTLATDFVTIALPSAAVDK